jgi:hypothetical protein
MYCPACAAPIDGMRYCRACGANVSLIPQALSGQLSAAPPNPQAPAIPSGSKEGRPRKPPSVESISKSLFGGVGMFVVALLVWRFFPAGALWWFWLLIPAFGSIGHAVGQYWQLRRDEASVRLSPGQVSSPARPPSPAGLFETGQGSVTDQTTRHLGGPGPDRPDREAR